MVPTMDAYTTREIAYKTGTLGVMKARQRYVEPREKGHHDDGTAFSRPSRL